MAARGKSFAVDTRPTKEVVVDSLTRDASVRACVFDLIDNSVDAARSAILARSKTDIELDLPLDYSGNEIDLKIDGTRFEISDNCGGIPVDQLKDMVLRFGQRSTRAQSIGTFGVGLNRALFRLGRLTHLTTDTGRQRSILVLNTDDYLRSDSWELPAQEFRSSGALGTQIEIQSLHEAIARDFADSDWVDSLKDEIGQRYGRFIAKSLRIVVNGSAVTDKTIKIRENSPYDGEYKFYKTDDGIAIHLRYGQHRDHRFTKEEDYDADRNKGLTKQFGWTVFCNDRAVIMSDQTYKTGWETKFHSEFYGFVGYVNFVGEPGKLPWTTTKTDVDLNNSAYQKALEDMRAFAEKWRGIAERRKKSREPIRPIPPKGAQPDDDRPKPTTRRTSAKATKAEVVSKPVTKSDHNQFRTVLPEDVDEKHCFDKHLALVHEAKKLDLGDFCYVGAAIIRMLFETSFVKYMERHGKTDDAKKYAIEKREKKLTLTEEAKKQLIPTFDEMISFLENNYEIWGAAKTTYLKHSCKRMGAHQQTLNSALHNPFQPLNRSQAFVIRDEVLPLLRHLIEN